MKWQLTLVGLGLALAGCGRPAGMPSSPTADGVSPAAPTLPKGRDYAQEGHGGDIVAGQVVQQAHYIFREMVAKNVDPKLGAQDLAQLQSAVINLPVFSADELTSANCEIPVSKLGCLGRDRKNRQILLIAAGEYLDLSISPFIKEPKHPLLAISQEVLHLYLTAAGIDDSLRKHSETFTAFGSLETAGETALNLVQMFTRIMRKQDVVTPASFRDRGRQVYNWLVRDSKLSIEQLASFKKIVNETPVVDSKGPVYDRESGQEVDAIAKLEDGKWTIYYHRERLGKRQLTERRLLLLVFHEYARVLGLDNADENYRFSYRLPSFELDVSTGELLTMPRREGGL